jgi:hypothetical protein
VSYLSINIVKLRNNVIETKNIVNLQDGIVWKENNSHEIQFFSQFNKTWGFLISFYLGAYLGHEIIKRDLENYTKLIYRFPSLRDIQDYLKI